MRLFRYIIIYVIVLTMVIQVNATDISNISFDQSLYGEVINCNENNLYNQNLNNLIDKKEQILDETIIADDNVLFQDMKVDSNMDDAEISISLFYNNAYSESIVLPGEELNAEFCIVNNSENELVLCTVVSLYDSAGKFIGMNVESISADANDIEMCSNKVVIPAEHDVASAKILIWESSEIIKPYTSSILLTLDGEDFFGDDYMHSQALSGKNKVHGKINDVIDTDVFSFVAQSDGLYYFETFSEVDTYASLYEDGNMITPIAVDDNSGTGNNFRLSATLESGKNYYLYVNGRSEGEYSLNNGYSIGNVFGTVSPVRVYENDTEYSLLIQSSVEINAYHTGEFVAKIHLNDWSESSSEYASYAMTGLHSGEYIVKTKRPGYLTHYQKISLDDNIIDLGNIALIPGDVNGDDVINYDDANLVSDLLGTEYGDEFYLCSADINSDKIINDVDLTLVNENINKNSNEYASNVNVLIINTELRDSQLIVTGNAVPDTVVSCVVFYDGYSVYEEEVISSEVGSLEFLIDLNRSGNYIVFITSENQAFEISKEITY